MKVEPINNKSLIETLQAEAASNEAFKSMCVVFAFRKRARSEIRLPSLIQKMHLKGFEYSKQEYQHCLAFMADQGLGILEHNKKDEVIALKAITMSLQSIGRAALQNEDLKALKKNKHYKRLRLVKSNDNTMPYERRMSQNNEAIKVTLKGMTITFDPNTSTEDVLSMIKKLSA